MPCAEFCNFLILNIDDLAGKIPIGPMMVLPDMQADCLHINSLLVHLRQAKFNVVDIQLVLQRFGINDGVEIGSIVAALNQRPDIVDITVTVNINGQHPLAVDHDLASTAVAGLAKRIQGSTQATGNK